MVYYRSMRWYFWRPLKPHTLLPNTEVYRPKSSITKPTENIGACKGLLLCTVKKLIEVALPNTTFSLRILGLE